MSSVTMNELHFHRENDYVLPYNVIPGTTCEQCGSGEVHQPMQTMDLPMWVECLRCGNRME